MPAQKGNVNKETETKTVSQEINIEELKKQIEADVRAQIAADNTNAQADTEEKAEKQAAVMEVELAKQEKSMKQKLQAEKKVKILIPENPINPNEVVPVGLNGVIYAIPTGQEFEVPESIYNVWKYSYDKTREANKKMEELLNKEIKILD
jgi:hypothetical protein